MLLGSLGNVFILGGYALGKIWREEWILGDKYFLIEMVFVFNFLCADEGEYVFRIFGFGFCFWFGMKII